MNSLVEKALVGSALGDDALVGASSAEHTAEAVFLNFFLIEQQLGEDKLGKRGTQPVVVHMQF